MVYVIWVKELGKTGELPILSFKSGKDFAKWLASKHSVMEGVWLQFFKKSSGVISIPYEEALDEALCYGWIDGQIKKYDEYFWLHKFTPRRPKSTCSKRNVEHAERLIRTKKMRPAGLKAIEEARVDGRWDRDYDSSGKMQLPEDFLRLAAKNKSVYSFFMTLNKANKYAITWRLQTAVKPETRKKRMMSIIEMLKKKRVFH